MGHNYVIHCLIEEINEYIENNNNLHVGDQQV